MFNSHIPVSQGSNPIIPTLIKLHQKTSINHTHQNHMINPKFPDNITHELWCPTKLDNLTAKHLFTTPNTLNNHPNIFLPVHFDNTICKTFYTKDQRKKIHIEYNYGTFLRYNQPKQNYYPHRFFLKDYIPDAL